jgi:hypothetical protein
VPKEVLYFLLAILNLEFADFLSPREVLHWEQVLLSLEVFLQLLAVELGEERSDLILGVYWSLCDGQTLLQSLFLRFPKVDAWIARSSDATAEQNDSLLVLRDSIIDHKVVTRWRGHIMAGSVVGYGELIVFLLDEHLVQHSAVVMGI